MFFPGMFSKSGQSVTTSTELAQEIGLTYDTYTGKRVSSQRAMRRRVCLYQGACRIYRDVAMQSLSDHRYGEKKGDRGAFA